MYGENESDNNSNCKCDSSDLDKKTENKYNSPVQKVSTWVTTFIIHIGYLLIYLLFIYSVIIFNNQVFKSGVFDNIISPNGGYCAPFLEIPQDKSLEPTIVTSKKNSEYSNISIFNLVKFDYVEENISNCNEKNDGITTETGDHTYGYGGVSFKKKYVDYLYYIYYNKYFNLSKCIQFVKYNDTSYAYDDNIWGSFFRNFIGLRWVWVLIDLFIALPLMFFVDTTRKFLAYNIVVYTIIYKGLYNYINEGLLLLILGFLFVYYPVVTIMLLLGFPFIISGFTFFLVFLYNLFFQFYHYAMYSLKILNELTSITHKRLKKPIYQNTTGNIIYGFRLLGTILKLIIVFFMMIQFYIYLSPPVVAIVVVYTLVFLYIIIPFKFRGNTLNKEQFQDFINKENPNDKKVGGDPSKPTKVVESSQTTPSDATHLNPSQTTSDVPSDTTPSQTTSDTTPSQTTSDTIPLDPSQTTPDTIPLDPSQTTPVATSQATPVATSQATPVASSQAIPIASSDDKNDNKKIDISTMVNDNDNEDYSIINIWKGLVYKQRYLYLLITIIFVMDLSLSEIIDKKYNYVNYLIGLVILLIMLFLGYFFNLLICKNSNKEIQQVVEIPTAEMVGGGYITKFFEKKSSRKNTFLIDVINNFSEKNPLSIIKNVEFKTHKCNLKIENNSYVKTFEEMFHTVFFSKKNDNDIEMTQVAQPVDQMKH